MGMVKREMEEAEARGFWSLGDRYVCEACFCDPAVTSFVRDRAVSGKCDFCGDEAASAPIDDVVGLLVDSIRAEWRDATEFLPYDGREGGFQGATYVTIDLPDLVEWPVANEELTTEILEAIVEVPWASIFTYNDRPEDWLSSGWDRFVEHVSHSARYLFSVAPDPDSRLSWGEISPSEMLRELMNAIYAADLISLVAEGARFSRARIHSAERTVGTAADLGTPPVAAIKFSARMSAAGIPMFYGATDASTAIAEVTNANRSSVEDPHVTVGEFVVLKPMHLIDLASIPPVPSLFDAKARHLRGPIAFLHSFSDEVAKPVALDEYERIEYVPTQIITEYFRLVPPEDQAHGIDGVLYRSSVSEEGVCVALFVENDACVDMPASVDEGAIALDQASIVTYPLTPAS